MKILIVEDQLEDFDWISEIIQSSKKYINKNIEITRAENIKESSKKINNQKYNIIFLDLGMPESKGIDTVIKFLDIVSKNKINNHTPIVILTGLEDYSIAKESMKLGVFDFLIKNNIDEYQVYQTIDYATYSRDLPQRNKLSKLLNWKIGN